MPDDGFIGVDTFTYMIRDDDGLPGSVQVRVVIWKPVATTDASDQSVHVIRSGPPTTVETPDGDLFLEIEVGDPIQVRLNEDVSGCRSPNSGGGAQDCVSVEIFGLGRESTTSAVRFAEMRIAVRRCPGRGFPRVRRRRVPSVST